MALINPRVIVTLGRFSMARFFPGEKISQIHGTARVVNGRMCVAMYHPAAGLHQASLADTIRADFRKLPVYVEQARIMFQPSAEEAEERVAASELAREEVIYEPQTAAVLDDAPEPEAKDVQEGEAAATPGNEDENEPPDEKDGDYGQLTFF